MTLPGRRDISCRSPRQRWRRAVQLVMLMSFPASFYYFSPVIAAMGAAEGIVTGSVLLFGLLLASSLLTGRLFCSWICPAGALGDVAAEIRPRRVRRGRIHRIKYLVWAPWLALMLLLFMNHGGASEVQPFYGTEWGLSTTSAGSLTVYLVVVLVFVALPLAVGRRAACHTICWMAPFMIAGRWVGNTLRVPAVRLAAVPGCAGCGRCSTACPMSLDVQQMANRLSMGHSDCMLCGECIDVCRARVISYRWMAPARPPGVDQFVSFSVFRRKATAKRLSTTNEKTYTISSLNGTSMP